MKAMYLFSFFMTILVFCEQKEPDDMEHLESTLLVAPEITEASVDTITYEFGSLTELVEIMKTLNYSPEAWHAGMGEIPKIFMIQVPARWRDTAREISVPLKKHLFFHILAPLALESNQLIMQDRMKLLELDSIDRESWSDEQADWIASLAGHYKMQFSDIYSLDLDELKKRVDIIPVSLVMAQCADESGWGTSRFAKEGNALFGQWTWGKDAIKPMEQRSGMGNYGLARFDSPLASMEAYMLNLNTHRAYGTLRDERSQMRRAQQNLRGKDLAPKLDKYSERGQDYVDDLLAIIRVNKLDQVDQLQLQHDPVILLVPVRNEK
jgi:uncharacterized FlgJ-related protein